MNKKGVGKTFIVIKTTKVKIANIIISMIKSNIIVWNQFFKRALTKYKKKILKNLALKWKKEKVETNKKNAKINIINFFY